MIKVLIVEDSPVMLEMLIYTISADPIFKIVGSANNGEEAIEAVVRLRPDVIAMDWQMPKLNGLEATRIIMQTHPTPIVIVSGNLIANDVAETFKMFEAGALAIVKKPPSIDHPDYKNISKELLKSLKLMSEIKLVKRTSVRAKNTFSEQTFVPNSINDDLGIKIVVVGASTGGPLVLQNILSKLSKNIPVPILIVQHISKGFTEGFVEWLKSTTNFPIQIATDGLMAKPGHAYVAPDDYHLGVAKGPQIVLSHHGLENGLRPSVAYLFRTTAAAFGPNSVGILLTGMGRDGADELKLMRNFGAITFAQDKESSVVYGMPGEAVKLDAATHILSPVNIAISLSALIKKSNGEYYD